LGWYIATFTRQLSDAIIHSCFILCRYEDHRALDGGHDGMNVVREILQGSRFVVKDGG